MEDLFSQCPTGTFSQNPEFLVGDAPPSTPQTKDKPTLSKRRSTPEAKQKVKRSVGAVHTEDMMKQMLLEAFIHRKQLVI